MPDDVAKVARKLTAVQKRVVRTLPTDGTFSHARRFCRQRETRMTLTNSGITEPHHSGPVTMYCFIRLTPLGLAVRAHLEGEAS